MGKWSSIIRKTSGKNRFNTAIILAAGNSSRFGAQKAKQFVEISGVPVLVRSARIFEDSDFIDEIIVVTRRADVEGCRNILREASISKLTRVIAGGETRQESAKIGFDAANPTADYIAIHDAARCLLTTDMLEATMETAYVSGAAACATRIVDTIKKSNGADQILETVDRENMWLVQTPQIFMADMYRAASYMALKEHINVSDDCALVERLGFQVQLVECGKTNIKITYAEDVIMAEAILTSRKMEDMKNENRTRI